MFQKIIAQDYTFHYEYWKNVSDGAKRLVSRMLVMDPERRVGVDEILADPWIRRFRDHRPQHAPLLAAHRASSTFSVPSSPASMVLAHPQHQRRQAAAAAGTPTLAAGGGAALRVSNSGSGDSGNSSDSVPDRHATATALALAAACTPPQPPSVGARPSPSHAGATATAPPPPSASAAASASSASSRRASPHALPVEGLVEYVHKRRDRADAERGVLGAKIGIKRRFAGLIGDALDSATIADLRELHAQFTRAAASCATPHDGRVGFEDFSAVLRGSPITSRLPIVELFRLFDRTGLATVSYVAFLAHMATLHQPDRAVVEFCFNLYDLEGHGALARDQIEHVVRNLLAGRGRVYYGSKMSAAGALAQLMPDAVDLELEQSVEQIFAAVGARHVTFDEFYSLVAGDSVFMAASAQPILNGVPLLQLQQQIREQLQQEVQSLVERGSQAGAVPAAPDAGVAVEAQAQAQQGASVRAAASG